jgi:hypothetical protein
MHRQLVLARVVAGVFAFGCGLVPLGLILTFAVSWSTGWPWLTAGCASMGVAKAVGRKFDLPVP